MKFPISNRLTTSCLAVILPLCFYLGLSSTSHAADLYRWTDTKGVIHFTDKPPKGVQAEKVKTKKRRNTAPDEPEPEEQTSQENTGPKNAEQCKAERERLKVLQSNSRIRLKSDDGTIKDLTQEEINQEISLAKAAIQRYCE